ncbi:MAG TPA: YciI family protein [Stenotrophomonas sp.]|jgi:uncharacterized protein YciI
MKHFLVLALRKPGFSPEVVQPHLDFIEGLRSQDRLALTGGFADGTGGAYLLKNVDSLAQAREIVALDPLVLRDASELTVHEWNTR